MTEWNKDNSAWELGCWDERMIALENAATARLWDDCHGRVLDIGAGSGKWSHELFPRASHLTRADKVPSDGVTKADVLALPFGPASFDVVHARRLLSNLEPHDRHTALREIHRVLVPGGTFVLVDVWKEQYQELQQARVRLGLEPLPPPHMGKERLRLRLVRESWGLPEAYAEPVGAAHYISTRLLLPLMLGAETPPGLGVEIVVSDETAERYCVHRLLEFVK